MEPDNSLLYACWNNDSGRIKELIKNGKKTQLKEIIQGVGTPLHAAATNENKEIVDLLLSAGADIDQSNYLGNSPLLNCIENGQIDMAKFLIERGANVQKKGQQKRNALSLLILYSWSKDFADFLLQKGCEINTTARDKQSLLSDAASCNNEEAIEFLLEHGIEEKYMAGALCWAIIHNSPDSVELLLTKGASLEEMYVRCKGIEKGLYHTTMVRKDRRKLVELLIKSGVNFEEIPKRAVVVGLEKTKLSPYAYALERLSKFPESRYIHENVLLVELSK